VRFCGADQWGAVSASATHYTWTKLLLDQDSLPTEHDNPLLRHALGSGMLRLPPGKSAVEVCDDYLRHLHGPVAKAAPRQASPRHDDLRLLRHGAGAMVG
jgi:hypothetical protein